MKINFIMNMNGLILHQSAPFFEMLRSYFNSYCQVSTIHGLVYIGGSKSHLVEKVFWFISLVISLVLTGLLIFELIDKIAKIPIVVSLDDTPISVTEINFPSVSICPGFSPYVGEVNLNPYINMIRSGRINLSNFTELQLEHLQVISVVTNDNFLSKFNVSISTENFMDRFLDFNHFYGGKPRGEKSIIDKGNWTNKFEVNYTQVIGRNGFCFTFNFPTPEKFFNSEELSSDFNYDEIIVTSFDRLNMSKPEIVYPLNTSNAELGLAAVLTDGRLPASKSFKPQNVENGFHLTFHDPFEVVTQDSQGFFAVFGITSHFRIHPSKVNFDESISTFTPANRRCYFPDERSLKFFKVYNKINCEHECLANSTLEACDCVQFFMVRNQTTRICGVADWKCFRKVDTDFPAAKSRCNCFNSCEKLSYDVELRKANYNKEDQYQHRKAYLDVKFSVGEFYQVINKRRYTNADVLSFIGGLLGLFAGLSALSVVEVIYFSIRLLLNRPSSTVRPTSSRTNSARSENSHELEEDNADELEGDSYLKQFMEQSSIHSFNFVIWEKNNIAKLFWILAFVFSVYGFHSLASKSFQKFALNAVVVSQDSRTISVDQIPFPAITFSGDTEEGLYDLTFGLTNFWCLFTDCLAGLINLRTQVEMMVCYDEPFYLFKGRKDRFNYTKNSDFVDLLTNITSNSQKRWIESGSSSWLFNENPSYSETLMKSGIGFTFNSVDPRELFNMKASDDFIRIQSDNEQRSTLQVPWQSYASHLQGFTITLSNKTYLNGTGNYVKCKDAGFLIHSPYELPLNVAYEKLLSVAYGSSMEVLIKPEIIQSDENIRSMDLKDRKCYLTDEFQLKYFKHYTKAYCDLEVLSEITYERCGCVFFNYIRNESMNVCDIQRWPCVNSQKNVIFDGKGNTEFSRHCLPLCDSISYDFEVITSRDRNRYNKTTIAEASLTFRFQDSEVAVLKRYQLFPLTDFLCNIGGLLGLFAGISFLSIFETLYFFTIRLLTDFLRQ